MANVNGVWVLLFYGCMDFDYGIEILGVFSTEESAQKERDRRYKEAVDFSDVYGEVCYRIQWWPLNVPVNERGDAPFDKKLLESLLV